MSHQTNNSDGAAPAVADRSLIDVRHLSMAELQAVVTLMSITGRLSDEQRGALNLVVSLMPWYADVLRQKGHHCSIDTLYQLPAVQLAAAMRASVGLLAIEETFAQGGADLLQIAEILGR